MGIIKKAYYQKTIDPIPDRNSNRVLIFERGEDDMIAIHFRNVSWKLTKKEYREWRKAFIEAKEKMEGRWDEIQNL